MDSEENEGAKDNAVQKPTNLEEKDFEGKIL